MNRTPFPNLRMFVLVAFAVALVIPLGCGAPEAEPTEGGAADPAPQLIPEEVDRARAVYANNDCGICHGDDAEGTENAPALVGLDDFWDVDRMVRYLEDPAAFKEAEPGFVEGRTQYALDMPAYDQVPVDDRRVLARWLLSR